MIDEVLVEWADHEIGAGGQRGANQFAHIIASAAVDEANARNLTGDCECLVVSGGEALLQGSPRRELKWEC